MLPGDTIISEQADAIELAALAERDLLQRKLDEAELSPQEREVFELSATLTNQEIADKVGRSANQVGVEKHRAIRKLRNVS